MKKKQKASHRKHPIMGRSDIPYAQRLVLRQRNDIRISRDHSAKIAMFCTSIAMHEVAGIGYKRLVRFSLHFKDVVDEFYEDPDVGMAHARHRMMQMGMPISGDFFTAKEEGQSKRERELQDHSLQAVQIALICGAIAMNDEFGFGWERQKRISDKALELSGRYAKEGEQFLLEEMAKIGFPIVDGKVVAFTDEDGKAITPAAAKKEGYVCLGSAAGKS